METNVETIDRLARIETKLDALIVGRTDTERRLSRLERFVWVALGVGCAGGLPSLVAVAQAAQ